MAEVVLGLGMSHTPQLGVPWTEWEVLREKDRNDKRMDYQGLLKKAKPGIGAELTPDAMRKHDETAHAALQTLSKKLAEVAPDVLVTFGDDQQEQFHDDNMPMFCVFRGASLPRQSAHGRSAWSSKITLGTAADDSSSYPAQPELAEHLIAGLVDAGFDIACSNQLKEEHGLGHAFARAFSWLMPEGAIPMVPIMVNTFYKPNQPTPKRCYEFGKAVRSAIESWDADKRVAIVASGGLSHVIIDEEVDQQTLDGLVNKDPEKFFTLPRERLNLGTSEIRNWVALAGAMEPEKLEFLEYVASYRSPAGTGCGMAFAYWE